MMRYILMSVYIIINVMKVYIYAIFKTMENKKKSIKFIDDEFLFRLIIPVNRVGEIEIRIR